ncbi:alpha-1,3-mannosyltransferase ALG2 [Trichinella spiralis]|uniref:alpha-1,3-mannosyltransferase ALG2 n=1 Tax=Trichinella spiralis TaxID=6334 RepID=UPI0001EFE32F|nr:alpha-1,3-mannosyltransferase ALG2 [Trichinella spiralis]
MCEKGRIAFLHPDLGIGGAERLVVDAALSLKKSGYDVCLFTSHHDLQHCFPETANGTLSVVVSGDFIPRSIFGKCNAVCAYLRMIWLGLFVLLFSKFRFDVAFVDQISVVVPLLRLFSRGKIIFYCHFPDQLLSERSSIVKSFYRFPIDQLEDYSTSIAHCILVNSKFTHEVCRKTFKSFERHSCVHVLYPSFNASLLSVEKLSPISETVVPRNRKYYFLSLNRFEPKKNVELAIYAFLNLRETLTEEYRDAVQLVVAGGYDPQLKINLDYFAHLLKLCKRLHLNNFVSFVESPTEELKISLISNCTALLYTPSNEHFGIVPLEAMYCQVPVIACNSGGPMETVLHEKTGYLVPSDPQAFADVMIKFVEDATLKTKFGQAGLEMLSGRVALVTGASRGIGRGVALQLGEAGATVYITSNEFQVNGRGGKAIAVYCDHSKDEEIKALFQRIEEEQNGQLDILVNNAYSGIKCDRMAVDCAEELKAENVAYISIWPGAVQTELILNNLDTVSEMAVGSFDKETVKNIFINGESTEYVGKAVVHLAADKDVIKRTGRVYFTADIGREYGFVDVNNRSINSIRSLKHILSMSNYRKMAWAVPAWIRIPGWLMTAACSKL